MITCSGSMIIYSCGLPEVMSHQFHSLPFTVTFCILSEMSLYPVY